MNTAMQAAVDPTRLLNEPHFGHPNVPKTEEDVKEYLKKDIRTKMTLEQMHNLKMQKVEPGTRFADLMNPYMLGMCSMNKVAAFKFIEQRYQGSARIDWHVGCVNIDYKLPDLELRWKSQSMSDEYLSGVFFATESTCWRRKFYLRLSWAGAAWLGVQNQNYPHESRSQIRPSRLVAENFVQFALQDGDDFFAKLDAEENNLFSLTFVLDGEEMRQTLIAKRFCDIAFIINRTKFSQKRLPAELQKMLDEDRIPQRMEGRDRKRKVLIVIGLGDYKLDTILYSLALYLKRQPNFEPKLVLVSRELASLVKKNGEHVFRNEITWMNCFGSARSKCTPTEVGQILSKTADWAFVICPVVREGVAVEDYAQSAIPNTSPLHMYSEAIRRGNFENSTIPLGQSYLKHGLQVISRTPETAELMKFTQEMSDVYLPALHISDEKKPKGLYCL